MQQNTLEKLLEEYQEAYNAIPQEALELDLRVTFKTIQALAKGDPVSPAQLAQTWDMPLEQVLAILKQAEANGQVEINARGDLVGAVLSLNPTQHQISMDNQRFYAWCAYDAMYAPGVIGKPAQIVSKDAVTGKMIQVSITPDGVEIVQPESAVVSIVSAEEDMRAGPESTRCTHMLFFESRESAEQWMQGRTGVSILTVEEVFELAKEFQIKPARRLGLI
jgi:alkylmercury lyase